MRRASFITFGPNGATLGREDGRRWRWVRRGNGRRWKPSRGATGTPRSEVDGIAAVFAEGAVEFDRDWRDTFGTEPPQGRGIDMFAGLRPARGRPLGTAPRADEIAERRGYVGRMTEDGWTQEAIADELGWDVSTIRRDVAALRAERRG